MNSKRILSMVLSMVLLCSNVLAAPISSVVDMPTWWSQNAVEEAVLNDVLTAENDLVRPGEQLTRAEMAQGITNAFGATKKANLAEFTDVPTTKWYYDAMSKAVGMGIISGYGNGLIKPEKKITREEMFMIIYNALELEEGNVYLLNKFNDRNLVSDWAEKAAARMVQNNYVAGNAKGNLKPTESITREEFAQVMKNIFAKYYSAPGTYTDAPDGNVIISTPNVVLKDTTVTGDLIIADGVGTGEVTLDNVDVQGRTLVRGGGENSVKLINGTTLSGKLIINNNISTVRIYNSKSTIKNVEVKTPAIFEGEFGNIDVVKSTKIETKGDINNLILSEKSDVKVTSGEIKQVQVKDTATKTTISGEGKVTQVNVNANDVTVTVPKAKVTTGVNVTGVIAGTKEVAAGKTETVKSTSSSSGGGGGGGGGSSSGGSSGGGGGGGSSSSSTITIPTLKLTDIENGGKIDLGSNYNKFQVSYTYEDGYQTTWYTPTSKVLVESNKDVTKGWTSKTTIVKVKYGNNEKELRIRPETPSFDVNKDGELIIPNFEQVKSNYESKIDFWDYGTKDFIGQYKDIESMEDLEIPTIAEEYLYIRLKATNTMIASYPFAIWEDDAIVESVSEVKYDKNNVAYRKIETDYTTYIVTAENKDDKYLCQLGEGKTLFDEAFGIKVGDSLKIYDVAGERANIEINEKYYTATDITNIILTAMPQFRLDADDGTINLGQDWEKYQVAYSDNEEDFETESFWNDIVINDAVWYKNLTPNVARFEENEDGEGILDARWVLEEVRENGVDLLYPDYYGIRLKDNKEFKQIIQVRYIAEVAVETTSNGYNTAIIVGDDYENYEYNLYFREAEEYYNNKFTSSRMVLPKNAYLEIRKVDGNLYEGNKMSSKVVNVRYNYEPTTATLPNFELDTRYGFIDLGNNAGKYVYSIANGESHNWYNPSTSGYMGYPIEDIENPVYINTVEAIEYNSNKITIKDVETEEIQMIDLKPYKQTMEEIEPVYSEDDNMFIVTVEGDYEQYEYLYYNFDSIAWWTFTDNEEYFNVGDKIQVRLKGTDTKLPSKTQTITFLPEFELNGASINLGQNWDKYQVAYGDDIDKFDTEYTWKNLSTRESDWYSGISPFFRENDDGEGILYVNIAREPIEGSTRSKSVQPTYFGIRIEDEPDTRQIIQVREIAEVTEVKNSAGYTTAIRVGDDYYNYDISIDFDIGAEYDYDKILESTELTLPADATVRIYKDSNSDLLDSATHTIYYNYEEKNIMPNFELDTEYGLLYLGEGTDSYKYYYTSDTWYTPTEGSPLFVNDGYIDLEGVTNNYWYIPNFGEDWYAATENVEFIFANMDKLVVKDGNSNIVIEEPLNKYHQELGDVEIYHENYEIIVDDYSEYEYRYADEEEAYWQPADNLEFWEGAVILLRKKGTDTKLPSDAILIKFAPNVSLDTKHDEIDLGRYYEDYEVSYKNDGTWTRWYTVQERYLIEQNRCNGYGWSSNTTHVAIRETENGIFTIIDLSYLDVEEPEEEPEEEIIPEEFREAIDDLMNLGIMTGNAYGQIRPEEYITKAEMAVITAKLIGCVPNTANELKNEDSIYEDVETGFWYTGWINALTKSDILPIQEGDTTFEPDEKITQAEAITMLVRALGWGVVVDQTGTWPANYITKASELGLFKGAVATNSEYVIRGNAAIYIHNALDAKTWSYEYGSEGATLRQKYFYWSINGDMLAQVPEVYKEAVKDLVNLGIMTGNANGDFKAEQNITKAEMAVITAKLIGLVPTTAEAEKNTESIYEDVAVGEWYTGWINLLTGSGILPIQAGDTTFGPDDQITQAEAVTMLVRALGWGVVVDQTGTWPANYITKASELRLFRGTISQDDEFVTRGNAAIFAHNALDAETWDIGDEYFTLRQKYFGGEIPEKKYGIITVFNRDYDAEGDRIYTVDILTDGENVTYECSSLMKETINVGDFISFTVLDGIIKTYGKDYIKGDEIISYVSNLTTDEINLTPYTNLSHDASLKGITVEEQCNGSITFKDSSFIDLAEDYIVYNLSEMKQVVGVEEGDYVLVADANEEGEYRIVINILGGLDKEPPIFAAGSDWYKGQTDKATLSKIVFTNKGIRNVSGVTEYWNADVENKGDIFCYIVDDVLYIDGNGNVENKIYANADASFMFEGFGNYRTGETGITAIENLQMLDTSKTTNMNSMFNTCIFLKQLDLSTFDTTNVTDMANMFANCISLESVNLSSFNTANVTDMSSMFETCVSLESIDLSGFGTSRVTNMNSMFSGCGVKTLNIGNFNTENVTDMGCMFFYAANLRSLDISSFDTENVTDMNNMFAYCARLNKLDLSNFNTSNVTYMSGMFSDCYSLEELNLSSFDTSKVEDMSFMFYEMPELYSITLGNGFKFIGEEPYLPEPDAEVIDGADGKWYDESGIAYLPSEIPSNKAQTYSAINPNQEMTLAHDWYKGSKYIEDIETVIFTNNGIVPENATEVWDADNIRKGEIKGYLVGSTVYVVGSGSEKIKANVNASEMFYSFEGLKQIQGLTLLDTSNTTNMARMFAFCESLESVDLSSFDTTNVTNMRGMFGYCETLTTLNVSKFNTTNVIDMAAMFSGCEGLTELNVTNFNTTNVEYMESMFSSLNVTILDLSNFNTSKVKDMSFMFAFGYNLEMLNLSNFDTRNVEDFSYMFAYSDLAELNLSNFDTSKAYDMDYMFRSTYWLNKVTLGANFEFIDSYSYLPEANNDEGKWYDTNGNAYTSEEIAINHNSLMTYSNVNPTATTTMIIEKQEIERNKVTEELIRELVEAIISNESGEDVIEKIEKELLKEEEFVNELKDDIREELKAVKEEEFEEVLVEEDVTEEPKEDVIEEDATEVPKEDVIEEDVTEESEEEIIEEEITEEPEEAPSKEMIKDMMKETIKGSML